MNLLPLFQPQMLPLYMLIGASSPSSSLDAIDLLDTSTHAAECAQYDRDQLANNNVPRSRLLMRISKDEELFKEISASQVAHKLTAAELAKHLVCAEAMLAAALGVEAVIAALIVQMVEGASAQQSVCTMNKKLYNHKTINGRTYHFIVCLKGGAKKQSCGVWGMISMGYQYVKSKQSWYIRVYQEVDRTVTGIHSRYPVHRAQ